MPDSSSTSGGPPPNRAYLTARRYQTEAALRRLRALKAAATDETIEATLQAEIESMEGLLADLLEALGETSRR